ncbi:hypothetical protein [Vallitalea okinawensis]|uniref:hypothetical protein n=1 Tax=Vallitalea okinawensis TaxID=2078660 RepID=UPI000CFB8005|nr:hypothetical protein [Vallitalea okinawensis]
MKKKICSLIYMSTLLLAGCTTTEEVANQASMQPIDSTNNVEQVEVIDEINVEANDYLIVTSSACDMNGDGDLETIQLRMDTGDLTSENTYEGTFSLSLLNDKQELLNEIKINEFGTIAFEKDFPILFKDYTGDGVLDFNIGQKYSQEEFIYRFYSMSDDGLLEKLFGEERFLIKSYEKAHSYDFHTTPDQAIITYRVETDGDSNSFYVYESYYWNEDAFYRSNYVDSSKSYEEININEIESKFNKLDALGPDITEEDLFSTSGGEYQWLLDHEEEVHLYSFFHRREKHWSNTLDRLFDKRIENIDHLITKFNILEIDDITQVPLEEWKDIKHPNPEVKDLFKYSEIPYGDKTLVTGRIHLTNFAILFSEDGEYLDGIEWTDHVREDFNITFLDNDKFISVSPIQLDRGSGLSVFGSHIYEVIDNRLVKKLEYPYHGYQEGPYTWGYSRTFHVVNELYDEENKTLEVTYNLGIDCLGPERSVEVLSVNKTIPYQWDYEKKRFTPNYLFYDDHLDNELYVDSLPDEIFLANYSIMKELIHGDDYETKVRDLSNMAVLLTKCLPSLKRDELLQSILEQLDVEEDSWIINEIHNSLSQKLISHDDQQYILNLNESETIKAFLADEQELNPLSSFQISLIEPQVLYEKNGSLYILINYSCGTKMAQYQLVQYDMDSGSVIDEVNIPSSGFHGNIEVLGDRDTLIIEMNYRDPDSVEPKSIITNVIFDVETMSLIEIEPNRFKEKMNIIIDKVATVDMRYLLLHAQDEFQWFLERPKETLAYFITTETDPYNEKAYEIEYIITNKLYENNDLEEAFQYFNIDDYTTFTLDQVKTVLDSSDWVFQQELYKWHVEGVNYQLLVGGFKFSSFALLYDQEGNYLDGTIWGNKLMEPLEVTYRKNQNYYSFTPICMGYGTGIAIYGESWFEVFEGKLINRLNYPIYGHEAAPFTIGNLLNFQMVKSSYNTTDGNLELTYRVIMDFYDEEETPIEILKTAAIEWSNTEEGFIGYDDAYTNNLYEIVFTDGLHDQLFEVGYEGFSRMLSEDIESMDECDIGQITLLITRCQPSERRNELLTLLHQWYKNSSTDSNSEVFIEAIEQAM